MTRRLVILVASSAALIAGAWRLTAAGPPWRSQKASTHCVGTRPLRGYPVPTHAAAVHPFVEAAPLCPWREPERDRHRFFPGATGSREELKILSHLRVALIHNLGRPLTAEEMLLRPYRVVKGARPLGSVLVRRVKGEFGAIELVLAVSPEGRVRGVRLQRQREPEPIAAVLTSPQWLSAFQGRSADSPLRVGEDLPAVPPHARTSAAAIADGVRTALILLRAAEQHGRDGGRAA